MSRTKLDATLDAMYELKKAYNGLDETEDDRFLEAMFYIEQAIDSLIHEVGDDNEIML